MISLNIQQPIVHSDFMLEVTAQLPSSGITAILGNSGSGKTTLLRTIAGLSNNASSANHLTVNDEVWEQGEARLFKPAHLRSVGYVFQEASLFSHLTVDANLSYAQRRADDHDPLVSYDELLDRLSLHHLLARYPSELSGGERQRVAIARAILIRPQLLLFDEPFSSLDQSQRQGMIEWLNALKAQKRISMLYVSHRPDDVLPLADHFLLLEQGRLKASGVLADLSSDWSQA